jgi:hypothetical protein
MHQTARGYLLDRASQEGLPLEKDNDFDDAAEGLWLLDGDMNDEHFDPYIQKVESEATILASENSGSVWQHTFSLLEAHAILLELCVTYL